MHKISRNSFYDENIKRIDVLDNRFYFDKENPKIFYPSVTTILEAYPKGWALTQWHKSLGFNADIILQRAAIQGTNIHDAANKYVNGHPLEFGTMVDGKFVANYTFDEWEMICKFVEFWTEFKPTLIASEVTILSEHHKLGGTIDLIVQMPNSKGVWETWIIDTKSGNALYPSHELQVAAYATMWNEHNPDYFISRAGILHLNSLTRTKGKNGAIQGPGWQIKEYDRHYADAFKVFKHLRAVWDNENPTYEPKNYSLPGSFQLNVA